VAVAVRRADGVVEAMVEGKAVLIGPAGTHVVDLNEVGSVVWAGIDGERELTDLVELVRRALDDPERVPVVQVVKDVAAFLDELRRLELVQP
jgi:hypothetical protein